MPSRGGGGGGGSNKKTSSAAAAAAAAAEKAKDVQETEDPLQAVILADSFETRFSPLTLETPRCLLPLANTPLIEYSFEFLANSGVDEVYVYCAEQNEELLEEYIANSKWATTSGPLHNSSRKEEEEKERASTCPFKSVELIRSGSRSIGDAMRDLDKRGIMSNDFVVIYGDIVSSLPLDAALAEHRSRRESDKNAIMTMVLRQASGPQKYRAQLQGSKPPVFVIDPRKKRCLHYEQMLPAHRQARHRQAEVDAELLTSVQELDVHNDLIDCGIDICTPDVLALWSDNFDYEFPRQGFLHSVLKDYELNGKTIHTYIAKDQYYASRVRNLSAYDAVTRDVVSRWTYPFTPDANLQRDHTYRYYKGNVFKEEAVQIGRTSSIGARTVLGRGTSVGEGATVKGSVVGRNCSIGRNCVVENAYLFDNVTLGEGSEVRNALLASNVVVGKQARIRGGALVSFGVKLGDGAIVEKRRQLTRAKKGVLLNEAGDGYDDYHGGSSDEDDDKEALEKDMESEGLPITSSASLSLPSKSVYSLGAEYTGSAESISTLHSDADDDDFLSSSAADGDEIRHRRANSDAISIASSRGSQGGSADFFRSEGSSSGSGSGSGAAFLQDASSSIYDSLQKGHEVSTIQLELQGLRMAANASEHQVRRAVVTAFVRHILDVRNNSSSSSGGGDGKPKTTIAAIVKQVLPANKMIIERTLFDKDVPPAVVARPDQVDLLLLVQAELARKRDASAADGAGDAGILLLSLCHELYMLDVLEQEGLEQWWGDARGVASAEMQSVRVQTQKFMTALLEPESEEEEDDDDDDEEEEQEDSDD